MTINTYDIGDQVDRFGTFTTVSTGALVDPATVVCIVRVPNGSGAYTETTYTYGTDAELTQVSTGYYRLRLTVSASGKHFYRFKGTSGAITAGESWFRVRASSFDSP